MPIIEALLQGGIECIGPMLLGMVGHKIARSTKCRVDLDNVADFWKEVGKSSRQGEKVSFEGALSKYGPMLIGAPDAKREVHRAYRRSIPEEHVRHNKATVDAYLAFTAGQMVWRLDVENSQWVYLGLYHSIVRNSIPLFVEKDYYLNAVEKVFSKGSSPHVVEARVEGRVQQIPHSFISEFVKKNNLSHLIRPEIINAGKRVFGLMVDGQDSKISYAGKPRYLDGDMWVAVDLNGQQFFVSRFLDLANPKDLEQESEYLKKDVEEILPGGKIVFQFDQVDKLISGYQTVTVDSLINRLTGTSSG